MCKINKFRANNIPTMHKLVPEKGFPSKNQLKQRIESIIIRGSKPNYTLEVIYYAESSPDP